VHRIRDDNGADTFKSLMSGYQGVIVCDALKTHEAGARGNDAIAPAGCCAHVFRKFEEGAPDHPEANLALGELYALDERAEGDLTKKAALRKVESADVLATMKTWLWNTLKSLSIGNAAAYVVANWDRLTRFVHDARIPLDNTPPNVPSEVQSSDEKSLRFQVEARDRGRRHFLHSPRDCKARGAGSCQVPPRRRPRRRPQRSVAPPRQRALTPGRGPLPIPYVRIKIGQGE